MCGVSVRPPASLTLSGALLPHRRWDELDEGGGRDAAAGGGVPPVLRRVVEARPAPSARVPRRAVAQRVRHQVAPFQGRVVALRTLVQAEGEGVLTGGVVPTRRPPRRGRGQWRRQRRLGTTENRRASVRPSRRPRAKPSTSASQLVLN